MSKRANYIITTDSSPEKDDWCHIIIDGIGTNYAMNRNGEVMNIDRGNYISSYNPGRTGYQTSFCLIVNYRRYNLTKKRIMASLFVPIPEKYKDINPLDLHTYFKNADPEDFRIENIGWFYPRDSEIDREELPNYRSSTVNDADMVVTMYKNNKTLAQIQDTLNLSPGTIGSIIYVDHDYCDRKKYLGMSGLRTTKMSDEMVHDICKLLASGKYSVSRTAKIMGLKREVVYNVYVRRSYKKISKLYNFENVPEFEKSVSDAKVRKICELLQSGKYPPSEIARMCNTYDSYVSAIRRRKIRTNISKDYVW